MTAGRRALRFEDEDVGGDGDTGGDGGDSVEEDEQDAEAYDEQPRRRQPSTVGPTCTHGYDGKLLSAEGIRRELGKKDLQREFRRRALETLDTYAAEEFIEEEEID